MRLLLLPPLMALVSDLLLQKPPPITALPFAPATHSAQSGEIISVGRPYNKFIFHPSTGSCVLRKSLTDPLKLGPCSQWGVWTYTPQKFLVVKGTYFCLQAVDSGKPAKLGISCSEFNSQWEVKANAYTHLSTKRTDGSSLCLDVDPDDTLITNPCVCLSSDVCEPDSQWFEISTANTDLIAENKTKAF